MKTRLLIRVSLCLALVCLGAASVGNPAAASIIWNPPATISGGADVSTNGTLVYAYNLSGTAATVTITASESVSPAPPAPPRWGAMWASPA